ncbi:MAG: AAA family ATPase [candidate division KSB1 bacterium]|nr:AAA family ATPase [candidate division KSB1 bacterium]
MPDTLPIPKTKLMPPQAVERVLPRPHLVSRITRALRTCRLTLLSAPAGSGKTTLALQAIRQLQKVPVAWLRLSEDENDLQAFLSAVIAAWDMGLPRGLALSKAHFNSIAEKASEAHPLLASLLNELIATKLPQLVLVLDDYHVIQNEAVHQALIYLLDHAPPDLHMLITSRVNPPLPIARLRLINQLTEIHLTDLKFDAQEIRTYFQKLWQIELTPAEEALVCERTDGWVASLHLLGLTLKQLDDPRQQHAFLSRFTGSNRLIYQLLAEEVLDHQPHELRMFLLETSILLELSPQLCRAVTGNPKAAELLQEAYRRNLFLTALENRAAYRYHDLFADFCNTS